MRKNSPSKILRNRRSGFSLIELLFVCVILGIIAALFIPNVSFLLSGGHIGMGAREFASACRYARAMALLNQTPVDMVVYPEEGRFTIEACETKERSVISISTLDAMTNTVDNVESSPVSSGGGFGIAKSKAEREEEKVLLSRNRKDEAEEQDIGYNDTSFKNSINEERTLEGVRFVFDGYSDTVKTSNKTAWKIWDEENGTEGGSVSIRFRVNGTVRPFRMGLEDSSGERMYVEVNSVGSVKVLSK